jgi:hypothetical protein
LLIIFSKFFGTKANDNRKTLLHLVEQIVEEKQPYCKNFSEDFGAFIDQASKSNIIIFSFDVF